MAKKKRSRGSEKYRRLQEQKARQKERTDHETQYRDRAVERRTGKTEVVAELMGAGVDAKMSKFLGGDVEHTHLVRGLDFALLRKIRAEVDGSGGSMKMQPRVQEQRPPAHRPGQQSNTGGRTVRSSDKFLESTPASVAQTHTHIANGIAHFLKVSAKSLSSVACAKLSPPVSLRGGRQRSEIEEALTRVVYEYHLRAGFDAICKDPMLELPTLVSQLRAYQVRSDNETHNGRGMGVYGVESSMLHGGLVTSRLLKRVCDGLGTHYANKKRRKRPRAPSSEQPPPLSKAVEGAAVLAEDSKAGACAISDDIFSDVGKYESFTGRETAATEQKKRRSRWDLMMKKRPDHDGICSPSMTAQTSSTLIACPSSSDFSHLQAIAEVKEATKSEEHRSSETKQKLRCF